jgi:predicted esterase
MSDRTLIAESTIATEVHGRFLVRPQQSSSVLIGFHGYGESADDQLSRLAAIPGSDDWILVSVQGLYRFYERRTERVVASWMTRQDREFAIADNITYVSRVLKQVLEGRAVEVMVFAGFSQGVAMAFRAGVSAAAPRRHVIAVGGDVPQELGATELRQLSSVLICRGTEDQWYGASIFATDVRRLEEAGLPVQAQVVAGGHEWSREVIDAAGRFLAEQALLTTRWVDQS